MQVAVARSLVGARRLGGDGRVGDRALPAIARDHYVNFRLGRYDLGNMVQAVWSTAHGRPLEVTNGATGEQMIRLGEHVDPILALLAPLWIVAPSPLTLIAVQVGAVALGALPVFWLGAAPSRSPSARRDSSRSRTSPTRGSPGRRSTSSTR